jgi:hypothetical protein
MLALSRGILLGEAVRGEDNAGLFFCLPVVR